VTPALAVADAVTPMGSRALGRGVTEVLARAVAHVGGLVDAVNTGTVPSWLTVATGGALVGASFLFTSLLTDHEGIRAVNGLRAVVPTTDGLRRAVVAGTRALGVLGLVLVLVGAAFGSPEPRRNVAILVVWVGWWAGFTMSTYLVGYAWPLVNPWRTLAERLPGGGDVDLPSEWGAWPAVVGLLALVAVEVVSPLASVPRALGVVVVAYSAVTLLAAWAVGPDAWFERADPVASVFGVYGRAAPVQRDADGLGLRLPGSALADVNATDDRPGAVAFVVALLWSTTFDGLVTTPAWNDALTVVVEAVPVVPTDVTAVVGYVLALVVGFALFRALYRLAAVRCRSRVDTYLAPAAIERWFAPALVPIAAGYHVAHFSGYFLSLSPALRAAVLAPLSDPGVPQLAVLPPWFGTLQLAFVVLGHLLAVWVAHALALEVFPGLLRPIRSQYPFVVVMVAYTMTSAWVVGQPFDAPGYL